MPLIVNDVHAQHAGRRKATISWRDAHGGTFEPTAHYTQHPLVFLRQAKVQALPNDLDSVGGADALRIAADLRHKIQHPTIAGADRGAGASYRAGEVPIGDILRSAPDLSEIANVSAEQVANVASSEVDEAIWRKLLDRIQVALADPGISGVIITHGTDTLEETAYFLSLVASSAKPIVLVGSMRPGSAVSADGSQNLLDAARVATSVDARDRGAMVVMNDTIFDPASVTKLDVMRVNAFAAPTRGPIGDVFTEGPRFFAVARGHAPAFALADAPLPRVAIAYAYAGVRGEDILAAAKGAKGLVIAGVGGGGFSPGARLAVRQLTAEGVAVVRTPRQGFGDTRVIPPVMEERSEVAMGTIAGRELTPAKARILLMLALQTPRSREDLQSIFDRYGVGRR